jgi:cell wall-associated NlpC family hydrolase
VDLTEIPYENSDSENEPLFFRLGKSTGTAPSAAALKAAEANKPEVKPEETVPEVTEPEVTEPEVTEPEVTEPEATEPEATEPEVTEPEENKPAEDSKAAKMYGIGFVTASSGLRLRSAPNTTSNTLATASSNECIVIVSVEGSWYKVIYNLTEGYMHKDYLRVLTKENAELGYGKFIEATTSVYSGPAATYKVLDTAEKDEKAYIIGLNEGWYKVIFGDHIGYVSSDKLALTEIPYENRASTNYPRFFRLGRSLGTTPSADALNNNDTTIDGGSINGQTVVNKAKQYLGTPYVWGGTTPAGFDCSGFVYYVYNSLGYPLSRMITGMNSSGVYVPKSELKPGDIIIFANTYTTGLSHVGIYVGDGKFIHSPNSRSVVRIDDLNSAYYSEHYYSARRIYN